MRKKLIKYGNSHALVLDRTLLALLNIGEEGVVRLRVEGEKLIVTADKSTSTRDLLTMDVENVLKQAFEGSNDPTLNAIAKASEKNVREHLSGMEENPKVLEGYQQWMPGTPMGQKLQNNFQQIFAKYEKEMLSLQESAEYLKEIEELTARYEDQKSEEFMQEIVALQIKYAPNLANMHEEVKNSKEWIK